MQFLYPSFLWALLALAIPIIIHLFYFRRFKKIYFTNVKFLKEIKEETSSRNKLKNLLILAMRCLAVGALVFAFAQPFIPKIASVKKGEKEVSIYIDNSFSMKAEKENIPLIDLAKDRARKIVNAYSLEDRFQILTNDFEGRHQRLVSKDEALSYIDELKTSPSVQPVTKIIARQKQIMRGDNRISFILSDFQKSMMDLGPWTDSLLELNLIPIQHSIQKNVSIDSVWFVAPTPILNQNNLLVVKFTNHSDDPVEDVKANLSKDGQEKPIGLLNIDARSSVIDTVPIAILKPGVHEAEIKINDFPVQFDDKFYFSFVVKETVKVLSINQGAPDKYLGAMFKGINYFTLDNQNLGQIQFQKFKEYDLILLNDLRSITSGLSNEINTYLQQGGKVLVLPPSDADISSYNNFFSAANANTIEKWDKTQRNVATINTQDFVFSEVYEKTGPNLRLPITKANFSFTKMQNSANQPLLTYRDGSIFISKYIKGDGQLFVCSAPLNTEFNDLVANAEVFVPMIYKIALTKNKASKLSYFIGSDQLIEVDNLKQSGEIVYKMKGKSEFIPSQVSLGKKMILDVKNLIPDAGYYDLTLENKIVDKLAFNFNRKESNLDLYDKDELINKMKNDKVNVLEYGAQEGMKEFVGEKDQGIVLWKWFLIAALLFLLLETLFIRFLKN
jgi:hypothetical protein